MTGELDVIVLVCVMLTPLLTVRPLPLPMTTLPAHDSRGSVTAPVLIVSCEPKIGPSVRSGRQAGSDSA